MEHVYKKLEEDGKIGPFEKVDGKKRMRPFAEYPKLVTGGDGVRHRVNNLNEEMEVVGPEAAKRKLENDPLAEERRKLAAEQARLLEARKELESTTDRMKAKLSEFEKHEAVQTEDKPAAKVVLSVASSAQEAPEKEAEEPSKESSTEETPESNKAPEPIKLS